MTTTEEEFNNAMMEEFMASENLLLATEKKKKLEYRLLLKGLINVDNVYNWLDEQTWMPEGIVDIELTDYKMSGYGDTQTCKITSHPDGLIYLKTSTSGDQDEEDYPEYYYVWQQTSGEDSFYGYLLFPLSNGQFFKVSYSC